MNRISGDYQYRALKEGSPVKRFWHESRLILTGLLLGTGRAGLVLDAGCGSGNLSDWLSKRSDYTVGMDLSFEAALFTKGRLAKGGAVNSSLEELPFASASFDRVFIYEVLEHMEEDDAASVLVELCRVLKPGGLIYLTTPNYRSYWPLLEFALDIFGLVPKMKGEQHLSMFWHSKLAGLLARSGFETLDSGSFNHISPFVAALSHSWAKSLLRIEALYLKRLGPGLFFVARKDG